MEKFKVLFLSGGSLVGRNLLDVLAARRENFHLICTNSLAEEPSIFEFDEVILSPSVAREKEAFDIFFTKILDLYNPDLVIPCRDDDVFFLAEKKAENISKYQKVFLTGPVDLAESFLDKWKSFQLSKRLGLPYAETISADMDWSILLNFTEKIGFPVIAKPKKGFASKGVFMVTNETQLRSFHGLDNYIIQEYLGSKAVVEDHLKKLNNHGIPLFHSFEDEKISIQASIGPFGDLGGFFITSHVMKQGISSLVKSNSEEKYIDQAKTWIEILIKAGWVGPLNLQCQSDLDGNLTIYEYNGRFTGATSARYFLGFDELGNHLSLWKSLDLNCPYKDSLIHSVNRSPASKFVSSSQIQGLIENGFWRKS
ncbi:hypothetical protein [Algoriphagus formosus]|uniref:hypothetical protein n=1 Tax=Algoriphagus formosus TaxID=2007308 RepID=UPI003F6FEA0F